jgi:hypothetical protein
MALGSAVNKQIAIKEEATYGTLPTASGAQVVRRVDFAMNMGKDVYESNEIRPDLQVADMRHGVRRVSGTLNGELSPGSYQPVLQAILKRDFTALPAITGASITIAASGPLWSVTRAAGSFITDGVRVGMVVRLTAGTFNAANLNKNLFVLAMTPTVLTVAVVNGTVLVAEGPIASATVSAPGRWTFVPSAGHTDKSFAIEEWFPDVPSCEVYSGCKFISAGLQLPPTGMATCSFGVAGQDLKQRSTTRYFTAPTAVGTSGVLAAVNGVLRIGGATLATVTGLSFEVAANYTGDPVIGANVVPLQFPGRVRVSGQFTAYFEDGTLRDVFADETQISLLVALSSDNTAAANFMSFAMTRVKLGSADKGDGEGGIVRTYSFTALLDTSGGGNEATTFAMQDSLAA